MSKKLLFAISVIFLSLALSSHIVYAQTIQSAPSGQNKKSYIVVKGGMLYPQGDLKDGDLGFNGEIAYGYRFHPNAAVEFSGGYLETGKTDRYSVAGVPVSEKSEVSAIPVTAAIKGIIKPDKAVDLYGMAGIGAYFVHGKAEASALGRTISVSDDTTVFGGFLGAGISYDLTNTLFVGLEGKYHWTTESTLRDSIGAVAIEDTFKVEGLATTLNLGFRF